MQDKHAGRTWKRYNKKSMEMGKKKTNAVGYRRKEREVDMEGEDGVGAGKKQKNVDETDDKVQKNEQNTEAEVAGPTNRALGCQ